MQTIVTKLATFALLLFCAPFALTQQRINPSQMPNSGVTAGSYGNPTAITVDSKGRVTAITGGSSFVSSYVSSAFNTANAGVSSVSATLNPGDPGNTVIVFVAMTNTADYAKLSIGGGGVTWTLIGANTSAASALYLASGISGAVTVTANFSSATAGTVGLAVVARTGVLTASPNDGTSLFFTYFGGTSESTGPVTTTNANDVLVAFGYATGSGTASITGTGFSTEAATTSGPPMAVGSATVSATGTYSATVTFGGQTTMLTGIAALKLAGTGAGTVTSVNGRTGAVTSQNGDYSFAQLSGSAAVAQLPAMVGDSGSGGSAGIVPAPAAGDAAAGKFLKADGTFAVPAAASGTNASQIQGVNVSATAPTTNQVLAYNGTQWAPAAASGSGGAMTNITGSVTVSGCTVTNGACVVSGSSTSVVSFSSIPSTYNHLEIRITARADTSGSTADVIKLTFNGDTAAHYDTAQLGGGTVTDQGATSAQVFGKGCLINAASNIASFASQIILEIDNYASTTFWRNWQCHSTNGNGATGAPVNEIYYIGGDWRNAANAISQVTLTEGGTSGHYLTGSSFSIYAIQ